MLPYAMRLAGTRVELQLGDDDGDKELRLTHEDFEVKVGRSARLRVTA